MFTVKVVMSADIFRLKVCGHVVNWTSEATSGDVESRRPVVICRCV